MNFSIKQSFVKTLFYKQYPQTFRINDWNDPWLPLPMRLLNKIPDSLIKKHIHIDESSILHAAKASTGLSDFGNADFLQPLRLLLDDFDSSTTLTPLGRMTARTILLQQLTARLCIEDQLKQQPQITSIPVKAPIFIAGLPRTGTTHLHNLLAKVSGLRFIPFWETLNPVVTPNKFVKGDHRRAINAARLIMIDYILPLFQRMHELELDTPHEELTLCALSYRSFFFEGAFQLPSYRPWYVQEDHTDAYLYLKKVLQLLQQENDKTVEQKDRHWILKSPQHVEQLTPILTAFPDAKIVRTHRDPVRAILSMISMVLYTGRQVYRNIDIQREASDWVDRLEGMLRTSLEQAKNIPDSQLMNVDFTEFMQAPKQTIRAVIDFAGIELDAVSEKAIDQHLQSHTKNRHGSIEYNFKDLGLNEEELKERFSFYRA